MEHKGMTREEIIKELERVARLLQEEVKTNELTDYAREQAYFCIMGAIQHMEENEEK